MLGEMEGGNAELMAKAVDIGIHGCPLGQK
jgi:hypothetical protein